jgi:DNA-binding NtrC family response regulator
MHVGEWDKQSLINASAVELLIEELRRGEQTLRVGGEIHLDLALQALQQGVSLAEIVQHAIEQLEKAIITKMLAANGGNKAEAARLLKIDYKTLYRKLKKHFRTVDETGSEPDELTHIAHV